MTRCPGCIALRQQQEPLAQIEDAELTGRYVLLQSQTASYLGDWQQAARSAEQAVAAAEHSRDDLTLGQAYHVLAMERYWTGYPTQGIDCSQRAIAALAGIGEDYRLAWPTSFWPWMPSVWGDSTPLLRPQPAPGLLARRS